MIPMVILGVLLLISLVGEIVHASSQALPIVLVIVGVLVLTMSSARKYRDNFEDDR